MTLLILVLAAIAIYYLFIYRDSRRNKFFAGSKKQCPNCHNPIEDNYNVCPICKETLKRKCFNCGGGMDASWKYCPYCEKPAGGSGDK